MKCAVIGGSSLAEDLSAEQRQAYEELGVWFAQHGIEVLTGGCQGYPLLVGEGCMAAGGTCIGYSPASDSEGIAQFGHSPDACSRYEFLDSPSSSRYARLLMRSIPLVDAADAVISIEGNWGTLFEQVAAVVCGKPMVVLESSGGASAAFHDIYRRLSEENRYDYGEQVAYVDKLDDLKVLVLAMREGIGMI